MLLKRKNFIMNYKLIAIDLDGTLYNDNIMITPKTIDALMKAQDMGIRIAISSGRPLPGLFHARDTLKLQEHHGMLVSYNGGKVVDTTTHEVLYENTIPVDLCIEILEHIKKYPVHPMIDDGEVMYVEDKSAYRVHEEHTNNSMDCVEVPSLIDFLDYPLVKILTSIDPVKLPEVIKVIGEPFKGKVDFIQTAPFYIEAVPVGISKASGLSKVCEKLDIAPDQIIAFGDAANDLEMVKFAGHGVAMGNACPELKECADEITLTNNEDGIAHTLNQLIFS